MASDTRTKPCPGRSASAMAADAAIYARIQIASAAVLVESFAIATVFGDDEPVPFYPTPVGMVLAEIDAPPLFPEQAR